MRATMRLNQFLEENSLTAAEFASRVGKVTGEAVRLWANGQRMPEAAIAQRIVDATGGAVTVQDLHDARIETMGASP